MQLAGHPLISVPPPLPLVQDAPPQAVQRFTITFEELERLVADVSADQRCVCTTCRSTHSSITRAAPSPHHTQRGLTRGGRGAWGGSSALGRVRVSPAILNLETDTLHMVLAEAFIVRFPELAETR
jgi:hypothetical protein